MVGVGAQVQVADGIQQLPDVLRVPLSEPLFILGLLFILVVMFLPGGIAGTVDAWLRRRRGRDTAAGAPLGDIDTQDAMPEMAR